MRPALCACFSAQCFLKNTGLTHIHTESGARGREETHPTVTPTRQAGVFGGSQGESYQTGLVLRYFWTDLKRPSNARESSKHLRKTLCKFALCNRDTSSEVIALEAEIGGRVAAVLSTG